MIRDTGGRRVTLTEHDIEEILAEHFGVPRHKVRMSRRAGGRVIDAIVEDVPPRADSTDNADRVDTHPGARAPEAPAHGAPPPYEPSASAVELDLLQRVTVLEEQVVGLQRVQEDMRQVLGRARGGGRRVRADFDDSSMIG